MTLGWARSGFVTAAADDPGPWAGGVTVEHLTLVHEATVPLRRVLLMLGYQVTGLFHRYPSSGSQWAQVDLGVLRASGVDPGAGAPRSAGQPWNSQWDGPTVALPIPPIMDARSPGLSMAIEFFDGSSWQADRDDDFLYVGYDDPAATPAAGDPAEVASRLTVAVEACVRALMTHGIDRFVAGNLAPEAGCGLFWLIDPIWWRPELETGQRNPSVHGRQVEKVGEYARKAIVDFPDAGGIFAEVVSGVPPSLLPADPEGVTLAEFGVENLVFISLGWAFGNRIVAALYADQFFRQLGRWLVERDEVDLLPEHAIDALRHSPWFEVLVTLVDTGVFTPTALEVGALSPEELADPVVAVRSDSDTVTLFVWDVFMITLARVRDEAGAVVRPDEPGGDDKSLLDPIEDFSWEYVVSEVAFEPDVLFLVAAPGVGIDIPAEPEPDGWRIEVIRVPDRALVPEWGTAVQPHLLLAPYAVAAADLAEETDPDHPDEVPSEHAVLVTPKPDGVRLNYPVTELGDEGQLVVEVTLPGGPPYTGPLYSGDERYAFDIFYYVDFRFPHYRVPYVSVWATAGVQVAVRQVVPPVDLVLENWRLPCDVWEVPSYPSVPAFGEPLPFNMDRFEHLSAFAVGWDDPPWTLEDSLRPERRFSPMDVQTIMTFWWVHLCADLAIGMIPIVGDVVGLAELSNALASGHDKWGRPVTNLDIVLMSVGVLMPLVTSGMASSMGRDVAGLTVGGSADDLIQAALRPAGLTDEVVTEATEKATNWWRLSTFDRRAVLDEIKALVGPAANRFATQLEGDLLRPEDVLNEAVNGLRHGELQRAFRQWAARRVAAGESATVEDYLRSGVRGRARVILQTLCGNDIFPTGVRARRAASAGKRYKTFAHIQFRPGAPAHEWLLARTDEVLAEVRRLTTGRPPPRIWSDQIYLADADVAARSGVEYAMLVEKLLGSLTATGNIDDLTVTDLRKIVGNKQLYPGELAALLVGSIDVLDHDLRQLGRALDEVLPLGTGSRPPLAGLSGYFQLMITGSGFEHSTRFETLIVADELNKGATVDMLRWGLPLRVSPLTDTMGSGPDVVRYADGRAILRQGKSYSGLRDLVADESWTNTVTQEWHGPEVLRQLWSDLQRLGITNFDVPGPPGTTGLVRIDGEITFTIDVRYYYLRMLNRSADPDALDFDDLDEFLYAELAPVVEDQFTAYLAQPAVRAFLNLPDDLTITLKLDFL